MSSMRSVGSFLGHTIRQTLMPRVNPAANFNKNLSTSQINHRDKSHKDYTKWTEKEHESLTDKLFGKLTGKKSDKDSNKQPATKTTGTGSKKKFDRQKTEISSNQSLTQSAYQSENCQPEAQIINQNNNYQTRGEINNNVYGERHGICDTSKVSDETKASELFGSKQGNDQIKTELTDKSQKGRNRNSDSNRYNNNNCVKGNSETKRSYDSRRNTFFDKGNLQDVAESSGNNKFFSDKGNLSGTTLNGDMRFTNLQNVPQGNRLGTMDKTKASEDLYNKSSSTRDMNETMMDKAFSAMAQTGKEIGKEFKDILSKRIEKEFESGIGKEISDKLAEASRETTEKLTNYGDEIKSILTQKVNEFKRTINDTIGFEVTEGQKQVENEPTKTSKNAMKELCEKRKELEEKVKNNLKETGLETKKRY